MYFPFLSLLLFKQKQIYNILPNATTITTTNDNNYSNNSNDDDNNNAIITAITTVSIESISLVFTNYFHINYLRFYTSTL